MFQVFAGCYVRTGPSRHTTTSTATTQSTAPKEWIVARYVSLRQTICELFTTQQYLPIFQNFFPFQREDHFQSHHLQTNAQDFDN